MEGESTSEEKQQYLREKILDKKGIEVNKFVDFLKEKKGEDGEDISNWTMEDLKEVVKEFYKIYNISLEDNINDNNDKMQIKNIQKEEDIKDIIKENLKMENPNNNTIGSNLNKIDEKEDNKNEKEIKRIDEPNYISNKTENNAITDSKNIIENKNNDDSNNVDDKNENKNANENNNIITNKKDEEKEETIKFIIDEDSLMEFMLTEKGINKKNKEVENKKNNILLTNNSPTISKFEPNKFNAINNINNNKFVTNFNYNDGMNNKNMTNINTNPNSQFNFKENFNNNTQQQFNFEKNFKNNNLEDKNNNITFNFDKNFTNSNQLKFNFEQNFKNINLENNINTKFNFEQNYKNNNQNFDFDKNFKNENNNFQKNDVTVNDKSNGNIKENYSPSNENKNNHNTNTNNNIMDNQNEKDIKDSDNLNKNNKSDNKEINAENNNNNFEYESNNNDNNNNNVDDNNITKSNLTNFIDKDDHDSEYGIIIQDCIKSKKIENTEFSKHKDIKIKISDPIKAEPNFFLGKSVNYLVTTSPFNYAVRRRYSDFNWLRETLINLFNTNIIPKITKKGKVTTDKHEDSFIQKRMKILERFINFITKNELIKSSQILYDFLTIEKDEDFQNIKRVYDKIKFNNINEIKERKSIEGEFKIKINKEKEIYLENIKDNSIYNGNLFKKLNNNFKILKDEFSLVIKRFELISDVYHELYNVSKNYLDQNTITETYAQMEIMFNNLSKSFDTLKNFINSEIREYYKFVGNNFNILNEMTQNVDFVKNNYIKLSKSLISKKNELFKKGDISKWELSSFDKNNSRELLKDKILACNKMLPKETQNCINSKEVYGFYLNGLINEFEKMRQINSYFHKKKSCFFCQEQIIICSNYTRILGDIIMTIDSCVNNKKS